MASADTRILHGRKETHQDQRGTENTDPLTVPKNMLAEIIHHKLGLSRPVEGDIEHIPPHARETRVSSAFGSGKHYAAVIGA